MSTQIAQSSGVLLEQISEARKKIAALEGKLRAQNALMDSLSEERQQHQLLAEIGAALEKLDGMNAAGLFWGADSPADRESRLRQLRATISTFQQKILALEQSRDALQSSITEHKEKIRLLNLRYGAARASEKHGRNRYAVVRTARSLPGRVAAIPWSSQEEDEQRFRRIVAGFLLFALLLGGAVALWKPPPPDREKEAAIPERLTRLVKKIQSKPPTPKPEPRKKEEKPDEQKGEKKKGLAAREEPKPLTAEAQRARTRAETKGVLAFKDNFADLMSDSTPARLGANARISGSGQASGRPGQRSIIMAQGGSGGIDTSRVGRLGVGGGSGGSGQSMGGGGGITIARVESITGVDMKESDRPLSKGAGPSRTDEDIQIVFDRYKSALYRIYNRELRNDPTLRGKMVLRITIEPDGRVSSCSVKSSDLTSTTLAADIVDRVLKFNFGAKEGVPAVTILYPIDFLPAT